MAMPVMYVGHMIVRMNNRFMTMPVAVGDTFQLAAFVSVLMMSIVMLMHMFMFDRLMFMTVSM